MQQMGAYFTSGRVPGVDRALGTVWKRCVLIMYLRKAMATILTSSYITQLQRDETLATKLLNWHNATLKAHIAIVTLPALISRNFWPIRTTPQLQSYFLQFPSYWSQHRQIYQDKMKGIASPSLFPLFEALWHTLPPALQILTPFQYNQDPLKHFQGVTEFLSHHVNQPQQDPQTVVNFINQNFTIDCPGLRRALVHPALVLILNPLHDADFLVISTNILLRNVYEMIRNRSMAAEDIRPFLKMGDSDFSIGSQTGPTIASKAWRQWVADDVMIKFYKDPSADPRIEFLPPEAQ